jgi:choline dehydrogenase-like flavoprotein
MDKEKHVQAVVIGAGGGGGVAAKVLATAGMQTVVFERGGWPVYDAHINDELISQRTQALDSAFGPEWDKHPRVYVRENGERDVINAGDGRYNHVATCVGSGTVSYGAMAWRVWRADFRLKSTYGAVEGSTLEDWPVSYDDLEPFYEQAEWEIGVSGDAGPNPFASPRKRPYPMPAFEYNRDGEYLAGVCRRMGLHPFPIPMLRNSVAYNGRAACIRNRTCCGYACPVDAKNGTQNTVIPVAIGTGMCRMNTHCVVAELMTDEAGRVNGVRYFDPQGKERLQTADVVVVACSAIETARLLLNSRSRLHPDGLGNNHDCVGRNLQGHAYTGASGLFDWDILDLAGPGATMAICDYNHHNPGIVGGGLLANEFYMMPYAFSQSRPWGEPGWGKAHKDYQRTNYRRLGRMIGPIQEMPMWDARVTVDAEVRDHWGIPVAALSGSRHPLDFEHCRFLSAKAEEILKEAGAIRTWRHTGDRPPRSFYGPSGGQHQAGTCRMGNDPETSVVNAWCQVHDVENLFIADGSVLVTNGGFNPVLTIMALAYRTAGYIVNNYR